MRVPIWIILSPGEHHHDVRGDPELRDEAGGVSKKSGAPNKRIPHGRTPKEDPLTFT